MADLGRAGNVVTGPSQEHPLRPPTSEHGGLLAHSAPANPKEKRQMSYIVSTTTVMACRALERFDGTRPLPWIWASSNSHGGRSPRVQPRGFCGGSR
jgi:hypothetical protein